MYDVSQSRSGPLVCEVVRKVRGHIVIFLDDWRMADILSRFGERLRAVRQREGLSQEALALESGLDRSYVGGVERGERNISLENIEKLAKALGVSVSELTKGT